jgi:hypothetical protein
MNWRQRKILPFLSFVEEHVMLKVDKVVLREKRLEDANNDYKWKTDGEITRLDATSPLNVIFSVYLSNYAEELCCPSLMRRRFAIETKLATVCTTILMGVRKKQNWAL